MILNGINIEKIFAYLLSIILFAHTIVPHHHHFDVTSLSSQILTCTSSNHEKEHEHHASHCIAFNILKAEKTLKLSKNQTINNFLQFYFERNKVFNDIPHINLNFSKIFTYKIVFLKQFKVDALLLRGPPN